MSSTGRQRGLYQIDDIERLMKTYKIGKAPLSLALGFGKVTMRDIWKDRCLPKSILIS